MRGTVRRHIACGGVRNGCVGCHQARSPAHCGGQQGSFADRIRPCLGGRISQACTPIGWAGIPPSGPAELADRLRSGSARGRADQYAFEVTAASGSHRTLDELAAPGRPATGGLRRCCAPSCDGYPKRVACIRPAPGLGETWRRREADGAAALPGRARHDPRVRRAWYSSPSSWSSRTATTCRCRGRPAPAFVRRRTFRQIGRRAPCAYAGAAPKPITIKIPGAAHGRWTAACFASQGQSPRGFAWNGSWVRSRASWPTPALAWSRSRPRTPGSQCCASPAGPSGSSRRLLPRGRRISRGASPSSGSAARQSSRASPSTASTCGISPSPIRPTQRPGRRAVNPPNVYGFGHQAYYQHVIDCLVHQRAALVDGLADPQEPGVDLRALWIESRPVEEVLAAFRAPAEPARGGVRERARPCIQAGVRDVEFGARVKIVEPCNLYGCKIGDDCFVGPFTEIQKGAMVGARTRVQSHAFICELVTIGEDCFVGHGVMFVNDQRFRPAGPRADGKELWRDDRDRQSGVRSARTPRSCRCASPTTS